MTKSQQAEALRQQNSSHLKIRTSVRHISKPISYFKIHLLSGISGGFAPIFPDTCYHLTHYWPAAADIPV
ncbi:hypothetical protein N6O29_16875, partial [Escherichia coli]|uniref:hypothetical protein n=1 Tax=Escherichia coli TaxID=562 RepID=UPI00234C5A6D